MQIKRYSKLYSVLALIFWIMRQFVIPNPFEALGEGLVVIFEGAPVLLSAALLNFIADPIIGVVTFGVVGLYYNKRYDDAAKGSALYMLFYVVHMGLIYLVMSIYPTIWLMVLIGVLYVGIHIAAIVLRNRFYYYEKQMDLKAIYF